jgi:serine/threonine-protein kinase RIO1
MLGTLMAIKLTKKLGEGAYADVWEATDEFDRNVAVKIIRASLEQVAGAMAHAKALARIDHSNVVRVFKIDKTTDPESGREVDCVVMELIKGETLRNVLRTRRLSREELRRIVNGLFAGLEEIHSHKIAHGDLHADNIMVAEDSVKILDILYLESLAVLSTMIQQDRLQRDVRSLRLIIQELIAHSEIDPGEGNEFNALLKLDANLADLRRAFEQVTSFEQSKNEQRQLDHAYSRFVDDGFVDSQEYAFALAEVTPQRVTYPLLARVIHERSFDAKRDIYVQQLWQRLDPSDKHQLARRLAGDLDETLPKGIWWPSLRMVAVLGESGWKLLPKVTQLRIEGLVVNDTLAGYHDIYLANPQSKGTLGTYARSLWTFFSVEGLSRLADNMISLLQQSWYTQNYVGKHFLQDLPGIAERAGKSAEMLEAVYQAVGNDARLIVHNIEKLPPDWRKHIIGRQAAAKGRPNRFDEMDDEIPF